MLTNTIRHRLKKQLLGEILLDRSLVDETQLDAALKMQKKRNGFVGKTLINMGFVSEHDVLIALGIQSNLPYIAIDKYQVNKKVIPLIPKEYAQEHHVMPLDMVGSILSVVADKPLDEICGSEIEKISQCQIASFVATRSEIDRAISIWYD